MTDTRTPDNPVSGDQALATLAAFVASRRRLMVLTGAGCSTESGIADYRDEQGEWKHARPVQYRDFVASAATRRRYWARSLVGWQRFSQARPNAAHTALVALQLRGHVGRIVTQNVDGLHQRAGSDDVIDLHGRLDEVVCLGCSARLPRNDFQAQLSRRNPDWVGLDAVSAPDGDASLERDDFDTFDVPACADCGGVLKPAVVFFGESVPRSVVDDAMASLHRSDGLLVVGSSLMVFSGYRFARAAAEAGIPVAAVNLGRTRADDALEFKVRAAAGPALGELVERLSGRT